MTAAGGRLPPDVTRVRLPKPVPPAVATSHTNSEVTPVPVSPALHRHGRPHRRNDGRRGRAGSRHRGPLPGHQQPPPGGPCSPQQHNASTGPTSGLCLRRWPLWRLARSVSQENHALFIVSRVCGCPFPAPISQASPLRPVRGALACVRRLCRKRPAIRVGLWTPTT
jgi:hypothetical protein